MEAINEEINPCPEWCEATHKIKKTGSHMKYDRRVGSRQVGIIFQNFYFETESGTRGWVIQGVLGEIRFVLDGSAPTEEIRARHDRILTLYQEVASARVATIEAQIKAAIES